MRINLLYDYETPNGFIPNGLNPAFLYLFIDSDFIFNHIAVNNFEKQYGAPSVWFGEQVIEPITANKIIVSDYLEKPPHSNTINLYVITPFGGASATYGYDYTYNEKKSFFHFIPNNTLELIKTDNSVFLFINYSNEGGLDFNWFRVIHKDAKQFGIPLQKIIYCVSDYFIDMNYNLWKKKENINDESINLLYLNWSLNSKARELFEIYSGLNTNFNRFSNKCSVATNKDIDDSLVRSHKFLMLNRRLRPHRIYTICMFHSLGIMNDVIVSYDIQSMLTTQMDYNSVNTNVEDFTISSKIIDSFNYLTNEKPISIIDYEDLENVWGFNFEQKEPYLNSYIHITSETNFFEIGGYFSEKTWKPIGHLQPFIFMGPAYGLSELKKLGFKTFSPFIDESYDLELNPATRYKMILSEINRISKLSITEIHNWYHSIFYDIILYNQTKLFSNYDYTDTRNKVKEKLLKSIKHDNTALL